MAERSEPRSWRQAAGPRLLIVGVLLSVWVLAVFAMLVHLQIVRHGDFVAQATRQQTSIEPEPAQRGDIIDRHGKPLAYTVYEDTVCAEPIRIKDARQTVARLCEALGDCAPGERARLEQALGRTADKFEFVRHCVSEEQARRVAALKLTGIFLQKEPHRYYPNKPLAANVLGFVGGDNVGQAGLEARYEPDLRGRPGRILVYKDGSKQGGKPYARVGAPPVPGATFETTIDANLQHIVERELGAGVKENRALGGCAVVMVPSTGEILGMASYPTFDPNEFRSASDEQRRNRCVQDLYEPGSTFKIVTGSAALEEKVMRPTDLIDTGNGTITIGAARVIREAQGHQYGTLSFEDVIVKSSNIGAVRIGQRLGSSLLGKYVERFGFGRRLSPDFRGAENAGIVWRPSQWTESALASVSMGYQIGVTPLQMVTAASTVANGGEFVQPRVVGAIIRGDRRLRVPPKVLGRVTSPETAAEMTSIMEGVVERGTATAAKLEDFTVAGKTGTANKNLDGHYLEHDYNVSFVGFAPSRQPALAILVVIDTPRGPNRPFGGTVAAPIFHRIANEALRYLAVPPTINPVPPVLRARSEADSPPAARPVSAPVTIVPASLPVPAGQIALPELRGLSGREALRILTRLGIAPRVAGDGIVIDQDPLPGSLIEPGGACRLVLGRPAPGVRP
jgi:cell division protein FtsI (penicillin-binding protein 3)